MNIKYTQSSFAHFTKHPAMGSSFHNWVKLLRKNGFRFDTEYLPKILFLTINSFVNWPVHGVEHVIFSGKIEKQKIEKPVFILGHPRSGTTYLHFVLSKDPQMAFCTTYEALIPNIFLVGGGLLKSLIRSAMPPHRPQDEMKITIDSPMEEEFALANLSQTSFMHGFYFPNRLMENFNQSVVFGEGEEKHAIHWKENFLFFLKKLTYKYPHKTLLLKSPANTGRVREIYELFPDARFIHIHRNPYEVYQSNERLYERILPITAFQKVTNAKVESYIVDSYEKMYRKYLSDRKIIPEKQLFEMRYDEFVQRPMEQLEKAYAHLGIGGFEEALPHFKAEIREARGYNKNVYVSIPRHLKDRLNARWGFAFEEFGYEI